MVSTCGPVAGMGLDVYSDESCCVTSARSWVSTFKLETHWLMSMSCNVPAINIQAMAMRYGGYRRQASVRNESLSMGHAEARREVKDASAQYCTMGRYG